MKPTHSYPFPGIPEAIGVAVAAAMLVAGVPPVTLAILAALVFLLAVWGKR